jgi:sulfoxide reductase heme-binding subunit YedZ
VALERSRARRAARLAVLSLGALPITILGVGFYRDALGANPIEEITHTTGDWALRFVFLSLAVTPLRKFAGWSWLAPERRTLGLISFFYACLHFGTYLGFDLGFDFAFLSEDVVERPYITVGFATFVILALLAATSNKRAIKRLRNRWTQLHRLVYLAAIGGVIHFLWLVKADLREPLIYAGFLCALLAARLPIRRSASR